MTINLLTRVDTMRDQIRKHYLNVNFNDQVLIRTKKTILKSQISQMNNDFKKIENYCRRILKNDSSSKIMIEIQYEFIAQNLRSFQRVFINFDFADFENENVLFFMTIDDQLIQFLRSHDSFFYKHVRSQLFQYDFFCDDHSKQQRARFFARLSIR